MEKKRLTAEEIFCGMPRLKGYFSRLDGKIKKFTPEEGESAAVEDLKKKRRELLQTARDMDCTDLQILYYIHNLRRLNASQLLLRLERLARAQDELLALIKSP